MALLPLLPGSRASPSFLAPPSPAPHRWIAPASASGHRQRAAPPEPCLLAGPPLPWPSSSPESLLLLHATATSSPAPPSLVAALAINSGVRCLRIRAALLRISLLLFGFVPIATSSPKRRPVLREHPRPQPSSAAPAAAPAPPLF
nr:proline-rich protein 36-like [Aegilops tauschii subsp. strangulata]